MEENKIILYKDEEGKVTPLSRICNPAQSDLQSDCPEYKHLQCVKK